MRLMPVLQHPAPYLAWLLLSALALVIANQVDPYVLAFATLAALWICPLVLVCALVAAGALWRRGEPRRGAGLLALALLGCAPTAWAVQVLSGIHWA